MRKITILEVWDPIENQYVSLKQAINQNLFNTETYLFFNPKEKKYYSITEAAQRNLFKSAIDLRPESLVVERIKILQTVSLLSARDPENLDSILTIKDAIAREIVDTNLRIYRNNNDILDLSVAINKDYVQVQTVKEITEKITETLTEKKTSASLGLYKKTETSSSSNLHHQGSVSSLRSEESFPTLENINGHYVMELSSSMNVSKRIQRNSQDFTAGYISEQNSKKLLDQQQSENSNLNPNNLASQSLNPIIDLNEAIRKEIVFLPDSLVKTQSVKYVIDLNTNERLDFDSACKKGIIDVFNRLFLDTRTNKKISLFEALGKYYIVMKAELYNNYEDNQIENLDLKPDKNLLQDNIKKWEKSEIHLTESFEQDPKQNEIISVFDPRTGEQIQLNKAIEMGLFDASTNKYIDIDSNYSMQLEEAVQKGMVVLKPECIKNSEDYQFLHINGILNPLTKKEMQLNEAIQSGILNYVECEVNDPESGQTLTLLEAYEKGILLTSTKNTCTPKSSLIIETSTSNLLDTPNDFKIKNKSKTLPPKSRKPMKVINTDNTKKTTNLCEKQMFKSQSQSPLRSIQRNKSYDRIPSRGKSVDQSSITSRASILSKFKSKLFNKGNKQKNLRFKENLIVESLRIVNTSTNEQFDLKTAIKNNLAISEDHIIDVKNESKLSIRQALEASIIRWFISNENTEYTYYNNSYIFGDNLYLIKYVLDPNDQKKLTLSQAFHRLIVDDQNHFYYGKKGPYSLESAIQKGYISCQTIDLNLLDAIIVSNIFKYSNGTNELINSSMDTTQVPQNQDIDDLENLSENEIDKRLEDKNYFNKTNNESELSNESDSKFVIEEIKENPIDNQELETQDSNKEEITNIKHSNTKTDFDHLPKLIKENISSTKPVPLKNGFVSIDTLEKACISYRKSKTYIITDVLDEYKKEFIPLKKALKIGIIKERTNEFIDSRNGNSMSVSIAIRKDKIKISEYKEKLVEINSKEAVSEGSNTEEISENNIEFKKHEEQEEEEEKQKQEQVAVTNENEGLKNNSSSFFNLIDVLLYKKISNGKYIRFDKVLKKKLYDKDSGLVKDQKTNELITLSEAFRREVFRINDPTILFDEKNIYKVESVLSTSGKNTLAEALKKKIISRRECTYKFLTHIYSIESAMKDGYIEGLIISNSEIRIFLDDYAKKLESNDANSNIHKNQEIMPIDNSFLKNEVELRTSSGDKSNLNQCSSRKNLDRFCEFFIFDLESEMYVSLSEAFSKALIISEPIRIVEPNSRNYISLKDAVIKGLLSCTKSSSKVEFKNRSSFYTMNRVSYIIDAILSSDKTTRYSLQDAISCGIFNGFYKILDHQEESYSIGQAIHMGYIIGKKVNLEHIETAFHECLKVPPSKPSRGIFIEQEEQQMQLNRSDTDLPSITGLQRNIKQNPIKFISDYSLASKTRSKKNLSGGHIELVKDCESGRYLTLDEALSAKIINFSKGYYVNTLTGNTLNILNAIENGFIILDNKTYNFEEKIKLPSRSLSQSRKKTLLPQTNDLNETNIIRVGRQFVITGVLNMNNKEYVDLDEAIRIGVFDINSATYINLLTDEHYTLVDSIDKGFVKIADENFRASYKLIMEEENARTLRKSIVTYPLRYIIHSITKQIIPINVAVENNLIDIENGLYIGYEKVLPLKTAYRKYLALTVDDLDRPNSKRANFKVALVKKSTTGKNMSVKSALAKNWLNFERRVYIDKQTNQEIPFSQAVDMDLLVLIANDIEEECESLSNTTRNNALSQENRNIIYTRSHSRASSKNI